MRKPLVALTVLSCLGLTACEDGPTQTYSPAPDGAGVNWNDGKTPGVTDPGTQGFGQQNGGTNKQQICTAPQAAAALAVMLNAPIKPPRFVANLDLAGGDSWKGLTIDKAEAAPKDGGNCQSTNYGDLFGDGNEDNYWGDNEEVFAEYIVSSRRIDQITLSPGYLGKLDLTSRDKAHTYSIPLSTRISKDGMPFTLDWHDPVLFPAEVNELYDALTATYAPGLPADPDCFGSGSCITGNFGDVAYILWAALGTGIWVDNQNAAQPIPSTITRIDIFPAKTLPFSLANPVLKLDAVGPVGKAGKLGTNAQDCNVQMGLTYDQFTADCVKVTGTAADTTEESKLLGGLTHSTERFFFDVQGMDLNFSDRALPIDDIIHDTDTPHGTDVATEISVDQSTLGKIANDFPNNDPVANPVKDLHGAGLIYLEYARLVQAGLNQYIPAGNQHQLGDPACLTGFGTSSDVDPSALQFPAGCTGFEGFVTASPATGDPQLDQLALGPAVLGINPRLILGMKPGHPQATFCLDANGQNSGYGYCSAPAGGSGDLFATSFARVLQVLGNNKVSSLPIDAQDIRFYWKQYVTAIIKYLKVAGSAQETPAGVHAAAVDQDDLFFDSAGSGQFETGEYVDRRFVSASQDPIDITVTADIKNGIFNDYTFSRDIYRGETAIYSSVIENPADPPAKEDTALLTNVFGSPILANGWSDVLDASGNVAFSAYYCATHLDPNNCQGQYPPTDANGKLQIGDDGLPRLSRYKGAIGGAATPFTLGQTPVKITQTYPNIGQAMISVPLHTNPYDASSPAAAPLQVLIPWTPKQPGIGFPIALTGTLDKFVQTSQLDFSGTTISANVDYDVVIDPVTLLPKADGSLQFLAVETTDFLGEVFLCQDPATGDLLGARMYSSVAAILDWLTQHPGTYSACGIIIRYSPYGNYADYITSTTNGVRLNITQGGGYGRVVDVTLFVPGQ